eukprot:768536-Hanusia_phi.AAC.16
MSLHIRLRPRPHKLPSALPFSSQVSENRDVALHLPLNSQPLLAPSCFNHTSVPLPISALSFALHSLRLLPTPLSPGPFSSFACVHHLPPPAP